MSDNTARMRTIFRTKTSKALTKMEDPRDRSEERRVGKECPV